MEFENLDKKTKVTISIACFVVAAIFLVGMFALMTSADTTVENTNKVYVMAGSVAASNHEDKESVKKESLPDLPQSLREQRADQYEYYPAQSLQEQRQQQLTGQVPPLTSVTIHNHVPSTGSYYRGYYSYPKYYYPYHHGYNRYYDYHGYYPKRYGQYW